MTPDISLKSISKKTSIVEDVIQELSNYILEGIMRGSIKKGDRIPSERELSESLGVGRSTLREAIKVLIMLGLLEVRNGQGTYITEGTSDFYAAPLAWGIIIGDKSIAELVEARLLLDCEAAFLATTRANDVELREIETALLDMKEACENENIQKFIDGDVRFHMAIAKAAHNAVIFQTVKAIRKLLELWIEKVLIDMDTVRATLSEHDAVYKCILSKDAEGARERIRYHVNSAITRLQLSASGK
jgi:GntR family transcriptional repressor for pyruvate dehydrogenase complex